MERKAELALRVPALHAFGDFCQRELVKFTLFASAIQVVTGLGIILAYHLSRKRVGKAELVGKFGTLPFQIFVFLCTLLATAGSFMG